MVDVIRKAEREDLTFIAENMQAEDVAEVEAVHGKGINMDTALYMAYLISEECHVGCNYAGVPMVVFGFCKHKTLDGAAVPWLLGTDEVRNNVRLYIRETKEVIRQALKDFDYLINYVHVENKGSIKFLKALGFTLHEPKPYGKLGELFHKFDKGDELVCINKSNSGTLLTGGI